jgi:hypothetical protein
LNILKLENDAPVEINAPLDAPVQSTELIYKGLPSERSIQRFHLIAQGF